MRKYRWIILPVLLIISFIYIYFFPTITYALVGEEEITLDYKEEFIDPGIEFKVFGFDMSDKVIIDTNLNIDELGEYVVTYDMSFGNVSETLERKIYVKDLSAPTISASFDHIIHILQEEAFSYPEFSAVDNYDGDITHNLVQSSLDDKRIGTHFIDLYVIDSNGNETTYIQPVAIHSDLTKEERKTLPTSLSSGIYQMQLNDDELTLGGYLETQDDFEKLFLISESEQIEIPVKSLSTSQNGYFSTVISLSTLTNGTYNLVDDKQNKLEEKGAIVTSYRLGRFHINDKLVSFFYEDGIQIKIEDFEYLYDIVIDPGHGGIDIGAEGISIYERDLNLKISLYEKERYEEHGLKVHLIRQGVNYPKLIGDADWTIVQKVGYTLGWYGAVSHYTYSNHHNADTYGYATGPEIVVPGRATKEELSVAYRLLNDFKKVYPKITTYWPLYMRSYETGTNISRVKGNIVDERSWYGFIRYPEECFGVNVTLFESAYISNPHDNAWYVVQGHWKDVSEAKIRAYVEALGKTYIPPKK